MTFAPILFAASAGLQALSSISQGNAQAASLKSQAQASDMNAKTYEENAKRVARENSIKEDNIRREQARILGRQRAAMAESGTGLGTGSNLDVAVEDTRMAELDALTARYQGDTERTGLLAQAGMSRYEAGVYRNQAKSARTQGYIGALGNAIGAGVSYYGFRGLQTPAASTRSVMPTDVVAFRPRGY